MTPAERQEYLKNYLERTTSRTLVQDQAVDRKEQMIRHYGRAFRLRRQFRSQAGWQKDATAAAITTAKAVRRVNISTRWQETQLLTIHIQASPTTEA
jgi:hypothetical protein